MDSKGLPGTPKASASHPTVKSNLETKFKSDGGGALDAMKRRIMGHYGDESKPNIKTPQQGQYPGAA